MLLYIRVAEVNYIIIRPICLAQGLQDQTRVERLGEVITTIHIYMCLGEIMPTGYSDCNSGFALELAFLTGNSLF